MTLLSSTGTHALPHHAVGAVCADDHRSWTLSAEDGGWKIPLPNLPGCYHSYLDVLHSACYHQDVSTVYGN